jgi:hypothetical protein
MAILPDENGVPEYETQDMFEEEDDSDPGTETYYAGDSSETTEDEDAPLGLPDINVADRVQVYWRGDHQWYDGTVTALNMKDREFEVFFPCDTQRLWHKACEYSVRRPE